jgi:hypothetical protein
VYSNYQFQGLTLQCQLNSHAEATMTSSLLPYPSPFTFASRQRKVLSTTTVCRAQSPCHSKGPSLVNVITTLMTCITNYYTAGDNGYLPSHLCTMGLATQLHNNAQARARAILPQAHRSVGQIQAHGFNVPIQGTLCAAHTDGCRDNGMD